MGHVMEKQWIKSGRKADFFLILGLIRFQGSDESQL